MSELALLRTGSPALDAILGGGLPKRSLTVISGEPGSGKTILAMQLLFNLARSGLSTLYLTTLSEPALKLTRYVELFSFYDPELVDRRMRFVDLGSTLLRDPQQALPEILQRVERDRPDVLVIDSVKAVHEVLQGKSREFVYELGVNLAAWDVTTLLIGEYSVQDASTFPEFSIADGIIQLGSGLDDLVRTRQLEVRKLRGMGYVGGIHFFDISHDGIAFYPRVRPPAGDAPAPTNGVRLSSGLGGLDELLAGGIPNGSATLVQGPTGCGKTLLSLKFLLAGAERGESVIHFGLDETPDQLRAITRALRWDVEALENGGTLLLSYTSPVELSPDRFLDQIRATITSRRASRVVLDGLSTMAMGIASERRFRQLIYALCKHVRASGATLFMTMETPAVLGQAQLTGHAMSSIADNVLLLRYLELDGRLERAISVLKARGVAHETEMRRFTIAPTGPAVGPGFRQLRGLLTGVPVPVGGGEVPSV